jgi:molybdopterin/thiamine biosynthesis adenylyltransferase
MPERDWFVPAGVAAGGIAVAEAFQWRRGDVRAGRRSQGLSLWRPEMNFLAADATGTADVKVAPSRVWLVGLGHLGQAYLWNLGLFSYAEPAEVQVLLQDDDYVTKANESTGLLTPEDEWRGRRKSRVLAKVLEVRGFKTIMTERRFLSGHGPQGDEPRLALIGVDNPDTRVLLSDAGFALAVDAGLGKGPAQYLDFQTHSFPGTRRSDEIPSWHEPMTETNEDLIGLPAYRKMLDEGDDRCGTLEVAGRTISAAFVGCLVGALVMAEAVRGLVGEHRYAVIDGSLRDLSCRRAVEEVNASPVKNPGYARLL